MEFLHNHLPNVSRHREKIAAALLVAAEDNGELTAEDNGDDECAWI